LELGFISLSNHRESTAAKILVIVCPSQTLSSWAWDLVLKWDKYEWDEYELANLSL